MKKHRTLLLLGVLGIILVVYGGDWILHSTWFNPLGPYHKKRDSLNAQIVQAERDLEKARKAGKELDVLRIRSLPSTAEVARSLYRGWLLEVIGRAGLTNPNVDSSEPVNRKGLYQAISFNVRSRGTLAGLTKFLFAFYGADQLHQIKTLTITPQTGSDQLDVQLTIEALILPNASRKDRLNLEKSERLASASLDDYQIIAKRNLFGVPTSEADTTSHTYLTSIISVDGKPEAWFTVRTSDTVLKLHQGETIDTGQFKGVVSEIRKSDVILDSDGERWLLTIGESLARAAAIPPER